MQLLDCKNVSKRSSCLFMCLCLCTEAEVHRQKQTNSVHLANKLSNESIDDVAFNTSERTLRPVNEHLSGCYNEEHCVGRRLHDEPAN